MRQIWDSLLSHLMESLPSACPSILVLLSTLHWLGHLKSRSKVFSMDQFLDHENHYWRKPCRPLVPLEVPPRLFLGLRPWRRPARQLGCENDAKFRDWFLLASWWVKTLRDCRALWLCGVLSQMICDCVGATEFIYIVAFGFHCVVQHLCNKRGNVGSLQYCSPRTVVVRLQRRPFQFPCHYCHSLSRHY